MQLISYVCSPASSYQICACAKTCGRFDQQHSLLFPLLERRSAYLLYKPKWSFSIRNINMKGSINRYIQIWRCFQVEYVASVLKHQPQDLYTYPVLLLQIFSSQGGSRYQFLSFAPVSHFHCAENLPRWHCNYDDWLGAKLANDDETTAVDEKISCYRTFTKIIKWY